MSISDRLYQGLKAWPRSLLMAAAATLVLGIGWIDWATGYEVTFFPFYSIPILLALEFVGKRAGIAISILSALAWWCADTASGHAYAQEWLRIWDAVVRLIFFCLVVVAGSAFRDQREANRARIALLEHSRKLEQEIVTISEREQRRIGRDLHDSLGQQLVALRFAADALTGELHGKSEAGARGVSEIAALLQEAVLTARHLARGLSPVGGDAEALPAALEGLAETTTRLTGLDCAFLLSGQPLIRDEAVAVNLYRIAQEAVTNAVKHSRARRVIVALDAEQDRLELRIGDDGAGFPGALSAGAVASKGLGLKIMEYRAHSIGATLSLSPNSPSGTVVTCLLEGAGAREPSEPL